MKPSASRSNRHLLVVVVSYYCKFLIRRKRLTNANISLLSGIHNCQFSYGSIILHIFPSDIVVYSSHTDNSVKTMERQFKLGLRLHPGLNLEASLQKHILPPSFLCGLHLPLRRLSIRIPSVPYYD